MLTELSDCLSLEGSNVKIVMRMRTTAVMMGKVTVMIQMVIKRRVMRMETMMTKIRTSTRMIVEMVVLIVRIKMLMIQSVL